MPSFDIVSEVDMHEITNAVDQANREVSTRFDFRGVDARIELKGEAITLFADVDFQLKQLLDILYNKMTKRNVDIGYLDTDKVEGVGKQVRQRLSLKQGIDSLTAKKIVKMIKDKKLKVQAQIQGDQVRVTGKKRDDLQTVMAFLRGESVDVPLQFNNFRD
ncbi:MAG: YajQ family cyclic di-GMP-binding protein [Gammaproteobacteria bacterium]|nr:YajQ family cyclic di-GMP-binding protein [Gammaproteobacteria bacterium]MCF6230305.1 YajQ family cyclic di-GMP-binding protein [Gammaproteobacteria bacterium]